jgi:hypothetical protein
MKTLRAALVVAAAATLACSSLKTTADYDHAANFSQYKTFAFQEGTPASTQFVQQRLESAIAGALQRKGMTQAPADSADLLVFTHAKVSTSKQLNATTMSYGGWWGPGWYGGGWGGYYGGGGMGTTTVQEVDIKNGTLVVDMVDRNKKSIVWRGVASDVVDEKTVTPENIQRVVDKLFEPFPPAPGAPAK